MAGARRRLTPYLYVLPIVAISGVLIYLSIGFTAWASLTDWNGLRRMDFVGLQNYATLLADRTFWIALRNNLLFLVVTVSVQAALGLLVAVITKERLRGSNVFKAIFFLPIAMAPAIIATVFKYMFEANYGSLNETLRALKIIGPHQAVEWLGSDLGVWSIIAINIFQWMGFSICILISAVAIAAVIQGQTLAAVGAIILGLAALVSVFMRTKRQSDNSESNDVPKNKEEEVSSK